jgi:hypothetical protein
VGTGKTTLAAALAAELGRALAPGPPSQGQEREQARECEQARTIPILATDDALWLPEVVGSADPWAAANRVVAGWLGRPGPWLIEGVRVPHALALAARALGRLPPGPLRGHGPSAHPLFDPPLVYLERAIHIEDRRAASMTASVNAAVLHCERRLGIPVLRCRYHPGLAADLTRRLCDGNQA